MTRTLPARMRPPPPGFKPQPASTAGSSSSTTASHHLHPQQQQQQPQPQLNPPSYYSTFHEHHFYYSQQPQRPRPQFYSTPQYHQSSQSSAAAVKFYRQVPSQINYKVASVLHNGVIQPPTTTSSTSSSSSSSTGSPNAIVTMRRPPASTRTSSSSSTASNRRNAVFIKEVTPETAGVGSKLKPPLPTMEATNQVPKPPPRSRPKSWTSTLFNAMRNNHRSVTFQCVDEEENRMAGSSSSTEVIVASDPTMPLAAASSADGQKFYSLPRQQPPLASTRSRTPSPFRSMIKGLVKGLYYFFWGPCCNRD